MLKIILLATYMAFLTLIIFFILNYVIGKLSEARDNNLLKANIKLLSNSGSSQLTVILRLFCSIMALFFIIYTTTNYLVPISVANDYMIYFLIPLLYIGYDEKTERSILVKTLILFSMASLIFKTGGSSFELFSFSQSTFTHKGFLNSYFIQDPMGFMSLTIALLEVLKQYFQSKRATTLVYLGAIFTLYVVVYFGGALPPIYLHKAAGGHRLIFSLLALFSFILKYLAIVFIVTLMALSQKKAAYLSNG